MLYAVVATFISEKTVYSPLKKSGKRGEIYDKIFLFQNMFDQMWRICH
jgi:hypothetical protein